MTVAQLEEGRIANALAGAAIAATTFAFHYNHDQPNDKTEAIRIHPVEVAKRSTIIGLAKKIKEKYKHVDDDYALHVATLAKKHEREVFPKAEDILAIAGVESSFNPKAKSGLRIDPARGLMQVRLGVWGIKASDIATSDQQIKHGADILEKYHAKLGDADSATHAYNVGLTNFKRKTGLNPKYVDKYNAERARYALADKQ